MLAQINNRSVESRRNFILAMLLPPFIISNSIAANSIAGFLPPPLTMEDDFVILAGWVLLKEDLTEFLD